MLADRITAFPAGYVHLWRDSAIGQIEMMPGDGIGYIGLFCLVPEPLGAFAQIGVNRLRLNVSPSNI